MTPIRNEKHEIIGYHQEQLDGQVKIRDKHGQLVGWTAFGLTRGEGWVLVSFQENEGLLYLRRRDTIDRQSGEKSHQKPVPGSLIYPRRNCVVKADTFTTGGSECLFQLVSA